MAMEHQTQIRRERTPGGQLFSVAWTTAGISFRVLVTLLILSAHVLGTAIASEQDSREYQIKAVFLYNFAQFTEWPTNAFESSNAPIVIGIVGSDPFGSVLDDTVRGESVRGRKLVVERYQRMEEIKSCHVLFISQSEDQRLESILERVKDKPILTVSDIEGSAYRGVMIRFITEEKIRLRVNLDAVENARLTLSSKLLRVAEIVPTKRRP